MESIILIGHGSPKEDANKLEQIGVLLHNRLHRIKQNNCHSTCIKVAYLQFARPGIMEAIDECMQNGAKRVILVPYFLSAGVHVTRDIPEIVKRARSIYQHAEFIYTEQLGIHDKLIQIIMERISTAKSMRPEEIEEKSLNIISDELDLSHIPADQQPIIKRVIHATADFEFSKTLIFHPDAIKTGIRAIKAGKNILTDVEMLKTGINKRRLERWGGKVLCHISKVSVEESTDEQKTRAELGIEAGLRDNNIGIIAIGNAPTALFKVIELLNNYHTLHQESQVLVIGMPVGFVNALESKSRLAEQSFPYITNISRKGGTPAAAAIVNALLKMADGES
jgi:precorrin-8X/cobalt-precorrin-8 methylmutase